MTPAALPRMTAVRALPPATRTMPADLLADGGAPAAALATDRVAFDIGWDHARHGLVPPPQLLADGTPVGQGWRAARAVYGRRTLAAPRAVRLWLALRLTAWREGRAFDLGSVDPAHLQQIDVRHCPVLRTPLGGPADDPLSPVVVPLHADAGYRAGNLAVTSRRAAEAGAGLGVAPLVRRARGAEQGTDTGLPAGAWWRLAALAAFATPLPFHEAARLPLALLPLPGLEPVNAVQRLQAVLTQAFLAPGWAARLRELAAVLPEHTLRHDFHLFVGAMAPRVLESGAAGAALRQPLEDAWLHERVQRRFQHLALSLGEAGVQALLARAGGLPRR